MLSPNQIVRRARAVTVPARHAGRTAADERRAAPRVPFALLVAVLVVGSLALLLALNTASAANELRRHGLVAKNAAVAARVQDLRAKVAASAAPANLARVAADLGMVPAGNPAFVVIGPDGKAVVMGKPKAVTAPPVRVAKPPKPTPKPTPSATAATPTAPVARPSGAATRPSGRPAPTTPGTTPVVPIPTPTPTPTPTVTLPGGTR